MARDGMFFLPELDPGLRPGAVGGAGVEQMALFVSNEKIRGTVAAPAALDRDLGWRAADVFRSSTASFCANHADRATSSYPSCGIC